MLYISGMQSGRYGVTDTDDGVTEYYELADLIDIVSKTGIKIKGFSDSKSKVPKQKPVIKDTNFSDVIDMFFRLMKKECVYYEKQVDIEKGYAGVRDWGDWVNPPDALDEEDYDWQELTPEWGRKLYNISQTLKKTFSDVVIGVSSEEKNWIIMQLERK